jgi:hypothetical protein
MRVSEPKGIALVEFDSPMEISEVVNREYRHVPGLKYIDRGNQAEWYGGLESMEEANEMARTGWSDKVDDWMNIAESSIESVERNFDVPLWSSTYEVSGSDVDVARYLSGEPENMIQFNLIQASRVGRVVSISVNIAASAMVSAETIEARGKCVTALVYALERVGIRTEIYADLQVKGYSYAGKFDKGRIITKVKDAREILDPAMVSFTLAHAGFFRAFGIPAMHAFPESYHDNIGVGNGGGYGTPTNGFDNEGVFPEGTIQIESAMRGEWDKVKAEDFVVSHLKDLGMISD